MIWIWNYNVTRTDLQKGIKNLKIWTHQQILFEGQIKMASGRTENPIKNSE